MRDALVWTSEEEEFLKEKYENKEKIDWNAFSIEMAEVLNLPRKSPQQCLEKFQQFTSIDPLPKIQWTQDQQEKMIQKHSEMGNKWAAISHHLSGKNDNCVKNHFYSKLRKMIRKLNRIIQFNFKKIYKAIPNATIYKLVQASEQRFKDKPNCSIQTSEASQNVITKMLRVSLQQQLNQKNDLNFEKNNLDCYKELIQQITKANKNYKKKSKKIKNSCIKAPLRTSKASKSKKHQSSMEEQQFQSEISIEQQKEAQHFKKLPKISIKPKKETEQQPLEKQRQVDASVGKLVQIKQGDEMQQLLKNIGLLHEGRKSRMFKDGASESGQKSLMSFSDFDNQSSEMSFCTFYDNLVDDSYDCTRKQAKMFSQINKNLFGDNSSQIEGL